MSEKHRSTVRTLFDRFVEARMRTAELHVRRRAGLIEWNNEQARRDGKI